MGGHLGYRERATQLVDMFIGPDDGASKSACGGYRGVESRRGGRDVWSTTVPSYVSWRLPTHRCTSGNCCLRLRPREKQPSHMLKKTGIGTCNSRGRPCVSSLHLRTCYSLFYARLSTGCHRCQTPGRPRCLRVREAQAVGKETRQHRQRGRRAASASRQRHAT